MIPVADVVWSVQKSVKITVIKRSTEKIAGRGSLKNGSQAINKGEAHEATSAGVREGFRGKSVVDGVWEDDRVELWWEKFCG